MFQTEFDVYDINSQVREIIYKVAKVNRRNAGRFGTIASLDSH